MRTHRLTLFQILALALLTFASTLLVANAFAQKSDEPAAEIIRSWNEAVSTIEIEDQNFREILASYKRNPPGRVLVAPDVRAEQKKRRLRLIAEIIASHEKRISAMHRLAKAEEASQ